MFVFVDESFKRLFLTLGRLALKVSRFITGARGRKVPHDDWINDEISHENRIFMNQRKIVRKMKEICLKWAAERSA